MTAWEPRSVLGFIIDAGWPADDRLEALARCWAASGGNDAYVSGGDLPTSTRRVGLWQVPWRSDSDGLSMRLLLDPVSNAQVAHTLWTRAGDYDWLQQRAPLVMRKAYQTAKVAIAAGRGATLLDSGGPSVTAHPPGPSATFGPGGLHAIIDQTITTLNARTIG